MKKNLRLIQSVQRAIDIINCFDEKRYKLSLNEISEELALNINTVRGIVNTLLYNGFLEHDAEDNKYSLGLMFVPKAELIGDHFLDRVKDIIRPFLNEISDKYEVSSRLQIISNYKIFTVETVNPESTRYLLLTRVGNNFPLHATSSGKLYLYYCDQENIDDIQYTNYTENTIKNKEDLLAELDFIKNEGYSTEFDEVANGISSVAIPVLDDGDNLIGTISITASTSVVKEVYKNVVEDTNQFINQIRDQLVM